MPRRRKHPPHENHERWLISYADFITLLFAFFVVMYATAQSDKGKAKQVAESVRNAIENGRMSQVLSAVLGGTVDDKGKGSAQMKGPGGQNRTLEEKKAHEIAELMPSMRVLSTELRSEIESGTIQVSMESRGLVVSFKQAALFPSGEDAITPDALPSVETVARAINKLPNPVRLEGHTDSRPINTARFKSNWQLSAARSIAVLDLLCDRFSVPRARLSIAGYAETAPVESNESEEGRARNRRVDIVILNGTGVLAEPAKAANP